MWYFILKRRGSYCAVAVHIYKIEGQKTTFDFDCDI
jgi:hypothetical protein